MLASSMLSPSQVASKRWELVLTCVSQRTREPRVMPFALNLSKGQALWFPSAEPV